MDSYCVWAKFIDEYRLLTSVADWVTTPELWDTSVIAAHRVAFGLGPDYKISSTLGNPFYFNLGSSHNAPFHEGASRQLVGIHVVPRSPTRHRSTLLVIRYGDLAKCTSQIGGGSWIKWERWRNFIIPIGFEPGVRELGLLRSHLLVICENLGDSLLRVYDFTIHSRKQQARDEANPGLLPPYTLREFLLSANSLLLDDFLFAEDSILALVVSATLARIIRRLI